MNRTIVEINSFQNIIIQVTPFIESIIQRTPFENIIITIPGEVEDLGIFDETFDLTFE